MMQKSLTGPTGRSALLRAGWMRLGDDTERPTNTVDESCRADRTGPDRAGAGLPTDRDNGDGHARARLEPACSTPALMLSMIRQTPELGFARSSEPSPLCLLSSRIARVRASA